MDEDPLVIPLSTARLLQGFARRANGGVSPQLVATNSTLSSRRWSINWEDVASVSIGKMPGTRTRSLAITPARPDALHRTPSKTISILARLDSLSRQPAIQYPETLFDRPLEEILAALSRKANRPLS